MSFSEKPSKMSRTYHVFKRLVKKLWVKKNFFFWKKFENFIRNILQQKIWIYNVKRIHNAQNHGLVHIDANHPELLGI